MFNKLVKMLNFNINNLNMLSISNRISPLIQNTVYYMIYPRTFGLLLCVSFVEYKNDNNKKFII